MHILGKVSVESCALLGFYAAPISVVSGRPIGFIFKAQPWRPLKMGPRRKPEIMQCLLSYFISVTLERISVRFCSTWLAYSERWHAGLGLACHLQDLADFLKPLLCKGKAVPLQAWSGPEGSRKLRFPDFMTTAQNGGKVVSLMHRPPLPPGNTPGTHFLLEAESRP